MPITIRELVIRTTITNPDTASAPPQDGSADVSQESFDDLVEECVAQVLERLQEQNER